MSSRLVVAWSVAPTASAISPQPRPSDLAEVIASPSAFSTARLARVRGVVVGASGSAGTHLLPDPFDYRFAGEHRSCESEPQLPLVQPLLTRQTQSGTYLPMSDGGLPTPVDSSRDQGRPDLRLWVRPLLFRRDLRVVIGLAQHAGECLQQRPRHGRVALHKRLEVPKGDSLADEFAVSGHRG